MSDWSGQRVTVMGLGLFGGGVAAARWLARQGAEVTVTDTRDEATLRASVDALAGESLRFVLGGHEERDFEQADWIIANPAVPPSNAFLQRAREHGARIGSELELALGELRTAPILISGTHGKSSTVNFTAQLLDAAGVPALAAGNIGHSLLDELEHIGERVCVVEVSSYQLEALNAGAPRSGVGRARAAALTPVTSDHLERHGTTAAYEAVKLSIFQQVAPGGLAMAEPRLLDRIERTDLERLPAPSADAARGLHWEASNSEGRFPLRLRGEYLADLSDLALPGDFQRENVARALALAHAAGAEPGKLQRALPELRGLPHRLEDLGARGPSRVIDNGVSTTPESTVAALDALTELQPGDGVLLGGRTKRGLDYASLGRELARRELVAHCFGADRGALAEDLEASGTTITRHETLEEAVETALGRSPRLLLFSPACASFDAFPNFRARALRFRELLPPRS